MTHKIIIGVAAIVLILLGTSQGSYAQAFDKMYAKSITLAGNGTDLTNTLTISSPTLSASIPVMFPGTNASGVLQITNTTTGGCSWVIPTPVTDLTPGTANTFSTTNNSSVVGWTAFSTDASLTGNGITSNLALNLAHSNLWSAAQTVSLTSTAASPVDALLLENTTTAASGTQEYAPRVHFTGQGWAAASQSADWIIQAVPISESTSPTTSYLDFEHSLNGGAYVSGFDVFASGGATLGITSPTDPGAGILNVGTGLQIGGAAGTGKVLVGNGTDYVASSATFPTTAGSAGNVIFSNTTGGFTSAFPYNHQYTISTNPAETTNNTTGVMMGLGSTAQFTPAGSGVVLILITGNMTLPQGYPTADGFGESAQIHYGPTGTNYPPANGYAANGTYSGTAVGSTITATMANGDNVWFFTLNAIVTGLTVGNTYWVDPALTSIYTGGTPIDAQLTGVVISIVELE